MKNNVLTVDSSMTESRSDPLHAPRYIVDRLLLSLKVKAPTILVGDFNLHHPRWNIAADPTKISKAQPLVHWLDRHKAKLLVCAEEINEHGGTLLRQNLKRTSVID